MEDITLPKPAGMPRQLFEKLKKAHVEADAIDKAALIDLLETLVEREEAAEAAHPAEAEFASLLGLDTMLDITKGTTTDGEDKTETDDRKTSDTQADADDAGANSKAHGKASAKGH